MTVPIHIEPRDGYLYVRFTGQQALAMYKDAVPVIAEACRRLDRRHILVDLSATRGSLGTQSKYELGVFVANQADGRLKVAILVNESDRDDRFFENVAANRGAWLKDFTVEADALAWLLGRPQ